MNAFTDREVLITGGMGFIGSNLARRLVDLGADVTLADIMLPENGGNPFNVHGLEGKIRSTRTDIRDAGAVGELVRGKHYLFNLAGQSSHMGSMRDPIFDLDVNCRGQICILEACRSINPDVKVVFASTRQVYGRPDYLPVDEAHAVRPIDINGVHKAAGESYHFLYARVHGLKTCSLRLTNVIGPRMRVKDAGQTFVGLWVRLILQGEPLEVWGGDQKRDFLYVDDAVDAFLRAATCDISSGESFNIGCDTALTLKELAESMIRVAGGGQYVVKDYPAERKAIELGSFFTNYGKAQALLGWAPRTSVDEALERTLGFYRENLGRYL